MAAAPLRLLLDVDNTLILFPDILNETLIRVLLKIKAPAHLFTSRTPTASIRHLMRVALATASTSDEAVAIQAKSPSLLTNLVAYLQEQGLEFDPKRPVIQLYDLHEGRAVGDAFATDFKAFEEGIKKGALASIIKYFMDKKIKDPASINAVFDKLDQLIAIAIKKLVASKLIFTWENFFLAVKELDKSAEIFNSYLAAKFYELNKKRDWPKELPINKASLLLKVAKTVKARAYIWVDDQRAPYEEAMANPALAEIIKSVHFLLQEPRFMSEAEYAKSLSKILARIMTQQAGAYVFRELSVLTDTAVSESKACGGAGARA